MWLCNKTFKKWWQPCKAQYGGSTGWFFWLVPPRKVLSMELVPPNRKKWPSTLVPPKTSWPRKVLSMELVAPNRILNIYEYLFFKELSFRLRFIRLCQTTWMSYSNTQRTCSTISTTTSRPWLSDQFWRWKTRPGLALLWVGDILKGGKCEVVSLLLQYLVYMNKWFGRLCWNFFLFMCLGWDQCTWSFFLLGGTSSILRTFLGGTRKKWPCILTYFYYFDFWLWFMIIYDL